MTCEHKFTYGGMRFCDGARSKPGGSARRRYYAHVYFCEKCLERRSEKVDLPHEDTFQPLHFGATPGSPDDCGVPREDR
jgi:hypothetical protein